MSGRRTVYEIYWEILVYCKSPRSFTAIINRCDLNSKNGQDYVEFLLLRRYLVHSVENGKTRYKSTPESAEFVALFSSLYQKLFDTGPGFRL